MINAKGFDLSWKDKYLIGSEKVDKEHQYLFQLSGYLAKAIEEDKGDEIVRNLLGKLYNYVKIHFESEEAVMRKTRYPLLKAHQKLHHNIIDEMTELVKSAPSKKVLSQQLGGLVTRWLVNHILYEDMKIRTHLQRIKQNSSKESHSNFLNNL